MQRYVTYMEGVGSLEWRGDWGWVETLAEDTSANSDSRAERPQKSESDRADQIVVTEHNSVS